MKRPHNDYDDDGGYGTVIFPMVFLEHLEPYLMDRECSALARTCTSHLSIAYFRIRELLGWKHIAKNGIPIWGGPVHFPADAWLCYQTAKLAEMTKAHFDRTAGPARDPSTLGGQLDMVNCYISGVRARSKAPLRAPISLDEYSNGAWKQQTVTVASDHQWLYTNALFVLTNRPEAKCLLDIASNDYKLYKIHAAGLPQGRLVDLFGLKFIFDELSVPEPDTRILDHIISGGFSNGDPVSPDYIASTLEECIDESLRGGVSILESRRNRKWLRHYWGVDTGPLMWRLFAFGNNGQERVERMIQIGDYSAKKLLRTMKAQWSLLDRTVRGAFRSGNEENIRVAIHNNSEELWAPIFEVVLSCPHTRGYVLPLMDMLYLPVRREIEAGNLYAAGDFDEVYSRFCQ